VSEDPTRAVGTAMPRKLGIFLLTTAAVFAADVISKVLAVSELSDRSVELVPGVLDLELTRNRGAAFGVAGGATILFTLVAVAVIAVIVRVARRLRSTAWAITLGLLLGGALGNLLDRLVRSPGLLRGEVVDWIHLHHWPVFNIADSAIVVGGLLAVLLTARNIPIDGRREPAGAPPDPAGEPHRDRDQGD
jgi:signal peptidase II